ncbi:MAG TPA: hypothetical protein VF832_08235 [Longimicrobiales bacterium]
MSARANTSAPFRRMLALAVTIAVTLAWGAREVAGAHTAARAPAKELAGVLAPAPVLESAGLLVQHARRGGCPASPFERESAEGRDTTPAPGCDPGCLRAAALPRRPARLASAAAAPSAILLHLHRVRAGSESCSATWLPPPAA